MIQPRMLWMLRPVDRSITVSRTPADAPHQLLHLLGGGAGHGGVADVGVHLHQEVAADDGRLQLRVVDVGGDDGAAAGDLVAHELGGDEGGDLGAEGLAVLQALLGALQHGGAAEVLAVRDVAHLLGDDPGAGELVLGDRLALAADQQGGLGGAWGDQTVAGGAAVVLGLHGAGLGRAEAAAGDPGGTHRRQTRLKVDADGGVGVGAGGVIHPHRRLLGRGIERDLAEGDVDVPEALHGGIHLAAAGDGAGGDGARYGRLLLVGQGASPRVERRDGPPRRRGCDAGPGSCPSAGMIRIRFADVGRMPAPQGSTAPPSAREGPSDSQPPAGAPLGSRHHRGRGGGCQRAGGACCGGGRRTAPSPAPPPVPAQEAASIGPSGRPPNRCTCRCGTSCPPCAPMLASSR